MSKKTIEYEELFKIVRSMKFKEERFRFFFRVCENGNLDICQLCLDAGIDVNTINPVYGNSVFNELASEDKLTVEVADWLIEKGADINNYFGCCYSHLGSACYKGNFEIAKYLIDKGAHINSENSHEGDLYCAVQGDNYKIVKMLLDLLLNESHDSKYDDCICSAAYNLSIRSKKIDIIELFLKIGADPDRIFGFDADAKTPLQRSVLEKDIKMANLFLKYNANVNVKLKGNARFVEDSFAITALDIAILQNDVEMQNLLTSFGAVASTKEEKLKALAEYDNNEKAFSAMKKILEL